MSEGMIQFLNVTPKDFLSELDKRIDQKLNTLKQEFQPKEPTEFLTRHEVASLLKIDISSVANWTKSGKLQSYALGGRRYYKRSEVEASIIRVKHS